MKKLIITSSFLFLLILSAVGQPLQAFTVDMAAGQKVYLGLKDKKAFSAGEATAVKERLDLALVTSKEDNKEILEWYNMEMRHEKVPMELAGNKTGISAISFDRDQFEKCKTAADLRRMTGHLNKNSFSHFAVIRNGSGPWQHCFIAETSDGKRALIYVSPGENGIMKVEVKSE